MRYLQALKSPILSTATSGLAVSAVAYHENEQLQGMNLGVIRAWFKKPVF